MIEKWETAFIIDALKKVSSKHGLNYFWKLIKMALVGLFIEVGVFDVV